MIRKISAYPGMFITNPVRVQRKSPREKKLALVWYWFHFVKTKKIMLKNDIFKTKQEYAPVNGFAREI